MSRELLDKHGIFLRDCRSGNHKTRCPRCSSTRKNKADPCLSVLVENDGIRWRCHHCGWSGIDDGTERGWQPNPPPNWRQNRAERGAQWRQQFHSGRW